MNHLSSFVIPATAGRLHSPFVCLMVIGVAVFAFAATERTAAGEVVLVDEQGPRAVVVIPDEPTETARYAAEELVEHVELATGERLRIVEESEAADEAAHRVYVGATRAAREAGIDPDDLPAEVALLRTRDGDLFIVGRDEPGDPIDTRHIWAGTLWGVYELLEKELGVRWLWPGELGTHVPETDRLAVAEIDERIEPSFERRHIRQRRRGNDARFGFTPEGSARYVEAETVFLRRHRMGQSHERTPYQARHSFTGWSDQYRDEHPEWFGVRPDGTRSAGSRASMCVSNPEVTAEIVRRFAASRRENPDSPPVLSIGENDTHNICGCDNCLAWDDPYPSEEELAQMPRYVRSSMRITGGARYARFWKQVHEALREIEPDVEVAAFIYSRYLAAPQQEIELHPNIVLAFAPWVPHPPAPPNQDQLEPTIYGLGGTTRAWYFPRLEEEQQWIMEQWDRWSATEARLYYRPNHTLGGYSMPHVYTRQFAEVFQHYAANGLKGTDYDALIGQWSAQGPTMYLLARLHVRPLEDVDVLLDEYYSAFGPAADAVRDYFDYWEAHTLGLLDSRLETALYRYSASEINNYGRFAHELFPPEAFDEGEAILDRADAAAAGEGNEVYRDRVLFLRQGLTHARLCAATSERFADENASADERRAALDELAAYRKEVEGRFIGNYHWFTSRLEPRSWGEIPGFFEDE